MVKNLVIGYIKVGAHPQEKKQVLKLISTMLSFTPAENEQIESFQNETESSGSKWFGGLLKSSPNKGSGTPSKPAGDSFTDLLIQYVDRESKPKANLKFDLSESATKKTDQPSSPSLLLTGGDQSALLDSDSAVKFFNQSLTSGVELVNRAPSQQQHQQQSTQNVANSILEQILK